MKKVLFSSAIQPYPVQFNNVSLTDVMSQRLTQQQDIFTLSGHFHCYATHLLAQNISLPSVFLEYPPMDVFEEEVKKGYDFVGITFFPTCMDNVLRMCQRVRKLSPRSTIILGGYGALAFAAAFPEDFKKEYADYVCIGDGIRLMRSLLGDPLDAPIRQRAFPKNASSLPWLDYYCAGNQGFVVAGLGCPSGCDFCSTTQMHQNQRQRLATPEEVFQEIKWYWRNFPDMQQVLVYDEDFIKYRDEVLELGRLIQEDTEFGLRKLDWFAGASIEALYQYDWDELVLAGLGGVFIGVESKFAPDSGYQKRMGDCREAFKNLLQRGISCLGTWMAGFDFHDPINLEEDLNYYISLEPTTTQLAKVTAFPGTPLWERMKEEGRLVDIPWEDMNFYGGNFSHPRFEEHEIHHFILEGYKKLYHTLGPTLMRQLKVEFNGYEYCRASKHRLLREERAERHKDHCLQLYPMVLACEYFAPNGLVRRKIKDLEKRYMKNFGEPSSAQKLQSYFILMKAFQEKIREAIDPRNRHPKQEPYKKYIYEKNGQNNGGMPYKVLYPRREMGYKLNRATTQLQMGIFSRLLGSLNKWDEERGRRVYGRDKLVEGLKYL